MTSMGEWELHGVAANKRVLMASDGQPYDELRYYVRRHFNRLIINQTNHFYLLD